MKTVMMLFLSAMLLFGCSGGDKEKEEAKPGKIETVQKQISDEAVRQLKTPTDRAKAVAGAQEAQNQKLREAAKE